MFKINQRFASLGTKFFTYTRPTPLSEPELVHVNRELLVYLGLAELSDTEIVQILAGSQINSAYPPLASVYAGHQFGVAVPQLGDGRALLIAEHQAPNAEIWELQLKGAGKTPYSRMGDGRAVLRSTLREYLASHAMHALNIPTTQALAMISSKTPVYRETVEAGAVVLRVAPSFIRFGHFEFFAKRNQLNDLKCLLDFVISNYYPNLDLQHPDCVLHFLAAVVQNTAELIAGWQALGFVHGVMNSDNMSILGLTMDYGPFMFMNVFRPEYAYNHSDSEGRYVYARQPYIAWWNLYRLAEALVKIYPPAEKLEQVLAGFQGDYNHKYLGLMATKLGLPGQPVEIDALLGELLDIFNQYQLDWTYGWRQLSQMTAGKERLVLKYQLGADFESWYQKWRDLSQQAGLAVETQQQIMLAANPALVLRNHLVQNAISLAEAGNYNEVDKLFRALQQPYQEEAEFAYYYQLPPSWSEHQVLSCSS